MFDRCYDFSCDIYVIPSTLQNVGNGQQVAQALHNGRTIKVSRTIGQKWSVTK